MLQTNSDMQPMLTVTSSLLFMRRCGASSCAWLCHTGRMRRCVKNVRGTMCVRAQARLLNNLSYRGCFSAASVTFWRHFTKGLSHYSKNSVSTHLKRFLQRLSSVAISAVLAKASRFLRTPSNDQNRGLKTKRNWTNQYRPQ